MKICHFGFFDPTYSRNRILAEGLLEQGADVVSVAGNRMNVSTLFSLGRSIPKNTDVLLVGYSDNRAGVLLAKLFFRGPVIWDAFYSLYDTRVCDRKLVSKYNPKAWLYWVSDWISIVFADGYIFDTAAHKAYFEKTFGAKTSKGKVVLLGSDAAIVSCVEKETIGFYGKYIPLQGVERIVEAAVLVPEYIFELIGGGQTYMSVQQRIQNLGIKNVTCVERLPYNELVKRVCSWKLALGIFGTSEKASRVIPNKVYDAAALGKATITIDTPSVRELFTHNVDIVLVDGSPESIAAEIKKLMEDDVRRARIGAAAKDLVRERASKNIVSTELLSFLRKYLQ